MAAKKQAKAAGTKSGAMTKWDERLAGYAQAAVATEANTGAGIKSFSIKSGVLSLDDVPFKNNEMAVVVVDHAILRRYDEKEYDAENPAPPTCFAVARVEEGMAPHPTVFEKGQQQSDVCATCRQNVFGSAAKGRGKACKERRRLVCLSAGSIDARSGDFTFNDDVEAYANGELGFLNVPVTSTMGWAQYVKQLKSGLNKPPLAVVTLVKLVPDQKSNFKVTFELLEEIEDERILEAIMDRHDTLAEVTLQPLSLEAQDDARDDDDRKPQRGTRATKPKGAQPAKQEKPAGRARRY